MSSEVIQKLQEKATVLTQERKKRGRTVPEELITQDQLRNFKTLTSLIVSFCLLIKYIETYNYLVLCRYPLVSHHRFYIIIIVILSQLF